MNDQMVDASDGEVGGDARDGMGPDVTFAWN
jgi:hypothetical protein